MDDRQGRFFVRVYDDARLLDSGEFRYLRNLKEIRVNGEPYTEHTILVPASTGHPPTKVRFIGFDGATVRPILPLDRSTKRGLASTSRTCARSDARRARAGVGRGC